MAREDSPKWISASVETGNARTIEELKKLVFEESRFSAREVDRRVGWSENYLSQILRGGVELRVAHVLAILDVLGISPLDFWARVFPGQPEAAPGVVVKASPKAGIDEAVRVALKRLDLEDKDLEEDSAELDKPLTDAEVNEGLEAFNAMMDRFREHERRLAELEKKVG